MALTVKSTPLSLTDGRCPRRARDPIQGELHEVESTGDNEYTCSCGEVFLWDDQFHWEAAPIGE